MMHHNPFANEPYEQDRPWRGFFGGWQGPRVGKGDLAPIILRLLTEKRMHGYEIIRTLEERSHGMWRPSAGSVYPILQLLEEQELVVSHEENSKKTYALTEKGQTEAQQKESDSCPPWQEKRHAGKFIVECGGLIRECAMLLRRIAFRGIDTQMHQVKAVLTDTRDRLRAILDDEQKEQK